MRSLDRKWKEFVYAACGFGPNLLMVLLGAYFTDAMNPTGLTADKDVWSLSGYSLVMPGLFGLLWAAGKAFDGIIDVPMAALTDNLRTRWGRRRPALLIAFIPMVLGYILAWLPLEWRENSVLNTVWMSVMLAIFFAAYTMSLITFYGSLSSVCADEGQRARVSHYKAFFDTIGYCVVYALIPVFLGLGINIGDLVMYATPLMLTMLIPLFIIKEGEKYGEGADYLREARMPVLTSLRKTVTNRLFMQWLIPHACAFFGLQMFLTGQNALISGVMKLGALEAAMLNTCAFAPVPIMLFFYNKLMQKKGIRFAYQLCLLAFAVAILSFCLGSEYLFPHSSTTRMIIGMVGALFSSFAIGSFFSTPYIIPSQIAAMEFKVTGKDHSAMYFAVQALMTSILGAASTGLVYENIKNITTQKVIDGVEVVGETWKVGVSIVPVLVSIACLVGFFVCFRMPKAYNEEVVRASLTGDKEGET